MWKWNFGEFCKSVGNFFGFNQPTLKPSKRLNSDDSVCNYKRRRLTCVPSELSRDKPASTSHSVFFKLAEGFVKGTQPGNISYAQPEPRNMANDNRRAKLRLSHNKSLLSPRQKHNSVVDLTEYGNDVTEDTAVFNDTPSPPVYHVSDDESLLTRNINNSTQYTSALDISKTALTPLRRRAIHPKVRCNPSKRRETNVIPVVDLDDEPSTSSASTGAKSITPSTSSNQIHNRSPASPAPVDLEAKARYQALLRTLGDDDIIPRDSWGSETSVSSQNRFNAPFSRQDYESQLKSCKSKLAQLTSDLDFKDPIPGGYDHSGVILHRSPNSSSPSIVFETWKYDKLVSKYNTDPADICRKVRDEFNPHRELVRKAANDLQIESDVRRNEREKQRRQMEDEIGLRMRLEGLLIPEFKLGEEEEKDEFPGLTEEHLTFVNNIWKCGGNDKVVVNAFTLQITNKDLHTLAKLNWLNDQIILFYFKLIEDRGNNDENLPTIFSFNTYFWPKLSKGGHSVVKRWTKKVDIFDKDMILIPVHLGAHWTFAYIDMKKQQIKYFDSMGSPHWNLIQKLREYLAAEMLEKKKKEIEFDGWNVECVEDCPQQQNGNDCGMFACKFAEYVSRRAKINFSQEHMPYFRKRMVWEIANKQLM